MNSFSFARFISFVFNPLIILILLPFFLVYKSTSEISSALVWTGYTGIFLSAIAVFIFLGVRRKVFSDWDVSVRAQRPLLFTFFIILGILYLLGLFLFQAPRILFIVTVSMLFGVLIVSAINMRIKASIHVATVAALILGAVLGFGGYYSFLLIFVPLVGWSRVKIKRHTVSETIVGGIVGSLLLLGIYGFFQAFLR